MNCLVLTDEDQAEYAPFQSAISTMPEFSKLHVMLCIFHGIWQSFKKDLYPLLDKNPHGQLIGEHMFEFQLFNLNIFNFNVFSCSIVLKSNIFNMNA